MNTNTQTTSTPPSKTAPKLLMGEAQSGESNAAILACNDYLRLGPGRSVRALSAHYVALCNPQNHAEPRKTTQIWRGRAPSHSYYTLREWSEKFDWLERAAQFDADEDERKSALRLQVLLEGLAQDYERVECLKRLGQFLHDQIYEQGIERERKVDVVCPQCHNNVTVGTGDLVRPYHNVWVPDVKQVGSGDNAERIDIEKFNSALISEFRGVLNDLAKEVGDRRWDSGAERKLRALYNKLDLNKFSKEQVNALMNPRGKEWFEILLQPYLCTD